MIFLDLFSGIGGFALGAYNSGLRFDRHYFSEIDPWCCKLYQRRFPDAVPLGDIKEINGAALVAQSEGSRCGGDGEQSSETERLKSGRVQWILSGGFPCQDISVAGKGAGITGARSGLWFEYARLIDQIRPRYAIMENVGALTRRGLDAVLGSLAEIGYDAEWSDIRASDCGAPHRRERIFILAYPQRSGLNGETVPVLVGGPFKESSMPSGGREEVADAECSRTSSRMAGQDNREEGNSGEYIDGGDAGRGQETRRAVEWWATEPNVGRVAHGVPARVDRLRGLGNAIVPQIAEMIFRQIKANMEEEE